MNDGGTVSVRTAPVFQRLAAACLVAAASGAVAFELSWRLDAQSSSPTYTREQAAQGRAAYTQACASCHGQNLTDGQFGPPLGGSSFRQQWGSKSLDELLTYMSGRMPPAAPGSIGSDAYVQILAHMLQQNGVAPGTRDLPSDPAALRPMVMPANAAGPGEG